MLRILLVDDEPTLRLSLGDALADAGHQVTLAADGAEAVERIKDTTYDLVLTDIRMPRMGGLALFREVKQLSPSTDVMLMTAYGEVRDAVAALKEGARDYLTKPFDEDELLVRVARVAERHSLRTELTQARQQLARQSVAQELIGRSPPMVRLNDLIETIAPTEASVLILGESGTGKELIARRLHGLSSRSKGAFVPVHCAAFPETLIEAELFGHERGAFTGAVRRRDGRFKAASGGTLFLDEVAEIPLPAQAKLLRVLQEGIVEPIGTNTPVQVDVRIISATHRDLKDCVNRGTFREDLYYRLNVLDIVAPPLRERTGDLPLLVEHFLERFSRDPEHPPEISPEAWATLMDYRFPGNVRELEHAVQHAVVLARGGEIRPEHMPRDIVGRRIADGLRASIDASPVLETLTDATRSFERTYLERALRATDGHKTKAAALLGISRKNLWEKLKAHGIEA
ncbi:MAG: sigma-54-dependent Fis family transcriptional regulator [Myxococcales bacterium]|nr:sigma-54-dependent Fis family transcriptional regulator [Myxococcales bacterium]MCB9544548.1 sigma-54-dependent Fis family transcriptional regulator [Myxococcales bacterium]